VYAATFTGARKAGPEALPFVLLGADAGLRRGEIIALEQTDADHRRGLLTVARSDWCGEIGSPKRGKTRRVPMTKRLAEALSAIRHLRGSRALYQYDGAPVTETTLRSFESGDPAARAVRRRRLSGPRKHVGRNRETAPASERNRKNHV